MFNILPWTRNVQMRTVYICTNKFNNENTAIIISNVVRPFHSIQHYVIRMDGWMDGWTNLRHIHITLHTQCSNILFFTEINSYCVCVWLRVCLCVSIWILTLALAGSGLFVSIIIIYYVLLARPPTDDRSHTACHRTAQSLPLLCAHAHRIYIYMMN